MQSYFGTLLNWFAAGSNFLFPCISKLAFSGFLGLKFPDLPLLFFPTYLFFDQKFFFPFLEEMRISNLLPLRSSLDPLVYFVFSFKCCHVVKCLS